MTRLQFVWWWRPSEWSLGHWRWPAETFPNWPGFGFHGFRCGPIEVRYWPQPSPPVTPTAAGIPGTGENHDGHR